MHPADFTERWWPLNPVQGDVRAPFRSGR
jgi:hypothetical protein